MTYHQISRLVEFGVRALTCSFVVGYQLKWFWKTQIHQTAEMWAGRRRIGVCSYQDGRRIASV